MTSLAHNGIRQRADALDSDADDVAVLDRTDSLRRSGQDQIARQQRHHRGDPFDDRADVVDHQRRPAALTHFAVHLGADFQIRRIDVGDDPRPDRTERVVTLATCPLPVFALLVARCHVVGDGVTEDVLRRTRGRDVLARPADHRGKFPLVVHRVRIRRQLDRHVRPDDRRVRFHEDDRILELLAAHLGDVRRVVLADAHHLARQNRRQQPHVGQWPLPTGESRRAERMLGDLPRHRVPAVPVDRDERDPVGTGDSTEAHLVKA